MQSIPMVDCPRGGFAVSDLQRPMDGHFAVGPGCIAQQPSLFGQQYDNPALSGPASGDQMIPGQQQPMHGFSPVGPVAIKSPSRNFHPGGPGFYAPQQFDVQPGAQDCPDQQLLTFQAMMLRSMKVMMQISQQQQHIQRQLQQAFMPTAASAMENVMAAAPSPSVHQGQEIKKQHFEVMTAAPNDSAPCEPALAEGSRMVHRRRTVAECSPNTTTQQIGYLVAEPDTKGWSTLDVTSDGPDLQKLVSVSGGPRQRPDNDRKDFFCHLFRPKLANSSTYQIFVSLMQTSTTLVAFGANKQHPEGKVVASAFGSLHRRAVLHGLHTNARNATSPAHLSPPWPPPTLVSCSFKVRKRL